MKKEIVIGIIGVAFIGMLLIALFTNKDARDTAENALHEIRTFDAWKPTAYCPTYPQGGQQYYSYQAGAAQQVAMPGVPPILAGQERPVLIKGWGAEVMPVGGGKVKITGVMGSSWADKAGLKAGDIILSFDSKKITSLQQFQQIVATAAPEKDYKVTFLRGSRTKKCLVTVGEGEMEGFTPIPQPK